MNLKYLITILAIILILLIILIYYYNKSESFTPVPTKFINSSSYGTFLQITNAIIATNYTFSNIAPPNEGYGLSVYRNGNNVTLFMGAPSDNWNVGSVYVYTSNDGGNTFTQSQKLNTTASGCAAFGSSTCVNSNGTLVVGAPNSNNYFGSLYVFTNNNGTWQELGPLSYTGGSSNWGYVIGCCVAISDDNLMIAAGATSDNNFVGSVWMFQNNGTNSWSQLGSKLGPSDNSGNSNFGSSVALIGSSTLIVGGTGDNNKNGAVWVFTLNNGTWTQLGAKLVPSDNTGNSQFGQSVSVSGNYMAIGGPQDNNGVGAVWIFQNNGGNSWVQSGNKLIPFDNNGNANFGFSVNMNGNVLVIGGPADNNSIGATWVFINKNQIWSQLDYKIVPIDYIQNPQFGTTVYTDGFGYIYIGGPKNNGGIGASWVFYYDTNPTLPTLPPDNNTLAPVPNSLTGSQSLGAYLQVTNAIVGNNNIGNVVNQGTVVLSYRNGNNVTLAVTGPGDNNSSGAIWIFTSIDGGNTYAQSQKLIPSVFPGNTNNYDCSIGTAMAMNSNTIIVGGDNQNTGWYVGGIWVFTNNNGTWSQLGPMLQGNNMQSNPWGDAQGGSLAISPDNTIFAEGASTDNNFTGTVWIFTNNNGTWTSSTKLSPNDSIGSSNFGASISMSSSNVLAIGGPGDGSSGNNGQGLGAVWIFQNNVGNNSSTWTQIAKLVPSGSIGYPKFGGSVSIYNNVLLAVGGPQDSQGVGAVWIFQNVGSWIQVAKVVPSDNNGPSLFGTSVCLNGDTLVVGGPGDANNTGAFWIFQGNGNTWSQVGFKYNTTDYVGMAGIGRSVFTDGSGYIYVGGPNNNGGMGATWVFYENPNQIVTCMAALSDQLIVSNANISAYQKFFSEKNSAFANYVSLAGNESSNDSDVQTALNTYYNVTLPTIVNSPYDLNCCLFNSNNLFSNESNSCVNAGQTQNYMIYQNTVNNDPNPYYIKNPATLSDCVTQCDNDSNCLSFTLENNKAKFYSGSPISFSNKQGAITYNFIQGTNKPPVSITTSTGTGSTTTGTGTGSTTGVGAPGTGQGSSPVQTPIQTPIITPVQTPIITPVQTPVSTPVQTQMGSSGSSGSSNSSTTGTMNYSGIFILFIFAILILGFAYIIKQKQIAQTKASTIPVAQPVQPVQPTQPVQ